MSARQILLLGNPRLYEVSEPIRPEERQDIPAIVSDLHDTMMEFRRQHGIGRAIAAPQIGVMKRILYMHIDDTSTVFINPELTDMSREMMDVWDDCMCFPDLMVRVRRHRACSIRFRNLEWQEEELRIEEDLSELLQHEYDHLDGILAISRAIDGRSFALRSERIQE
jgi:peptide deformylase